jgi:myosin heavy subunit
MIIAAAAVFFGLQIMMIGPLKSQLVSIQSRLDDSEKDMRKLVAERNQLWQTNDLLSGLQDQAEQIQHITATMTQIKQLRQHVEHEAMHTAKAINAFDSIAGLHKKLAAQDAHTRMAVNQLDDLLTLRESVVDVSKNTDEAMVALDELADLTDAAVAVSSQVEEAETNIDKLAELKYRMLGEGDGLIEAEKNIDRMAALQTKLASNRISDAEENANRLLVINDSLAGANTSTAGNSLNNLLKLEDRLLASEANVAEAVQTLEILDDFQAEVDRHVDSIENFRRTMVEIAMLEGSVGRAARVLKPLVELSNLRRLGEREVREAARVILDQRTMRLSQNSAVVKQSVQPNVDAAEPRNDLVPFPPEAREASAE